MSSDHIINLVSGINPQIWARQVSPVMHQKYPNLIFSHEPVWADIYFFFETTKSYILPNPSAKRIFISTEPVSLKRHSRLFLWQFDEILGSISSIFSTYSKFRIVQPALPWHIGIDFDTNYGKVILNYKDLLEITPPKIDEVSVITSDKALNEAQIMRVKFVTEVANLLGSKLHIYGRGFNTISDKFQVLSKYRYHIALENNTQVDNWSEKVADPIIALNRVYYFGSLNINDYFSNQSVLKIELNNPKETAELIRKEISDNHWEKAFSEILVSKGKVMNEFNLIHTITEIRPTKVMRRFNLPIFRDFACIPGKIVRKLIWELKKMLMLWHR